MSVEEILVVTFTEAATEELRGRIRSNIHDLRLACVRGSSTNPLLSDLLDLIDDKTDAVSQLLAAERQMDEAAIYTIHGFVSECSAIMPLSLAFCFSKPWFRMSFRCAAKPAPILAAALLPVAAEYCSGGEPRVEWP